jgi:hypothetical protein
MSLEKTINDLRAEKAKLEQVIAALEDLARTSGSFSLPRPRGRRGRKFMGEKERREVSARMKRYWAGRRKGARQAD